MRRRRVLATIGAFLLAGCGWQGSEDGRSGNENGNGNENPIAASDDGNGVQNGQQEGSNEQGNDGQDGDDESGRQDSDDGNGGQNGNGDQEEDGETGAADGDRGLIDRDAEELLLTEDEFASEEWVRQNVQRTGTCRVFERPYEDYALMIESCAELFDDEETAIEEYESEIDLATNIVGDPVDQEADIGDETVVLVGGPASVRVIFRDVNALGVVDYEADGLVDFENLPETPAIIELARAMHDRWRD